MPQSNVRKPYRREAEDAEDAEEIKPCETLHSPRLCVEKLAQQGKSIHAQVAAHPNTATDL